MKSTGVLMGALALASALPQERVIKRQVDELRDSYDFVVVGGGTAGLTVADRLSEAFPDRMFLVPSLLSPPPHLLTNTPPNLPGASQD